MLADERYRGVIDTAALSDLEKYLSKTWIYFGNLKYFDAPLDIFF